jgi:hypothetical protein
MPFMKTESVEAGERKPTETAHGGIKIGLANGRYEFSPDFDKKFDDMDAEAAELFDVVNEKTS